MHLYKLDTVISLQLNAAMASTERKTKKFLVIIMNSKPLDQATT